MTCLECGHDDAGYLLTYGPHTQKDLYSGGQALRHEINCRCANYRPIGGAR